MIARVWIGDSLLRLVCFVSYLFVSLESKVDLHVVIVDPFVEEKEELGGNRFLCALEQMLHTITASCTEQKHRKGVKSYNFKDKTNTVVVVLPSHRGTCKLSKQGLSLLVESTTKTKNKFKRSSSS